MRLVEPGGVAAGLVALLGVAIGFRPTGGAPGVLAGTGLLLVFALALSWVWTTLGLLLRTPQAVMSAGTVVLFPLTLASNVFVVARTMPGWLQAIVSVNPVSHLVTAERTRMAGIPAGGQIAWVLLASTALAAVFAPSPPGSTAGSGERRRHCHGRSRDGGQGLTGRSGWVAARRRPARPVWREGCGEVRDQLQQRRLRPRPGQHGRGGPACRGPRF